MSGKGNPGGLVNQTKVLTFTVRIDVNFTAALPIPCQSRVNDKSELEEQARLDSPKFVL